MRPIKFRAWNTAAKCWMDLHNMTFWDFERHGDPLELMQFTGLLDKNGKEIYEGDILESTWGKGAVYFREAMGAFAWPPGMDWGAVDGDAEIIGNIHENPDLLK